MGYLLKSNMTASIKTNCCTECYSLVTQKDTYEWELSFNANVVFRWKEEMRKKGFTIQLDAENRQGLRQTAADDQQMIVSYRMEEGDKGLRNAECSASLDTMEQEKEHK
jgi:hypothetical protein